MSSPLLQLNAALFRAAEAGDAKAIDDLLEKGADVEAIDALRGWRPLHAACRANNVAAVEALLRRAGADPNAKSAYLLTPLHVACEFSADCIPVLLRAKADPSIPTAEGRRPLHLACEHLSPLACLAAVKALLNYGAPVDATDEQSGSTALHCAAMHAKDAVVRLLASANDAGVNRRDRFGSTPVYLAAMSGHAETVQLLAMLGADLEQRSGNQYNPLMAALEFTPTFEAREAILLALLDCGAAVQGVECPEDYPYPSLDEALAQALMEPLQQLFSTHEPIGLGLGSLRWALWSPTAEQWRASGIIEPPPPAESEEEAERIRAIRLSKLREATWARRIHVPTARAFDWGEWGQDENEDDNSGGAPANESVVRSQLVWSVQRLAQQKAFDGEGEGEAGGNPGDEAPEGSQTSSQ